MYNDQLNTSQTKSGDNGVTEGDAVEHIGDGVLDVLHFQQRLLHLPVNEAIFWGIYYIITSLC